MTSGVTKLAGAPMQFITVGALRFLRPFFFIIVEKRTKSSLKTSPFQTTDEARAIF